MSLALNSSCVAVFTIIYTSSQRQFHELGSECMSQLMSLATEHLLYDIVRRLVSFLHQ